MGCKRGDPNVGDDVLRMIHQNTTDPLRVVPVPTAPPQVDAAQLAARNGDSAEACVPDASVVDVQDLNEKRLR